MIDDLENKIAKFVIRERYTYAMLNLSLAHCNNVYTKGLRHTITGLPIPNRDMSPVVLHLPKEWVSIWYKVHLVVVEYLKQLRNQAYKEMKANMKQNETPSSLTADLLWKNIYKFASKWKLATICVAVPEAVLGQLKRDFAAAYPDKDFETEWETCKAE